MQEGLWSLRLQRKDKQRARGDGVGSTSLEATLLAVVCDIGVDQQYPGIASGIFWQGEMDQIVMIVDHDQQRCLPPPLPYSGHLRPPVQQHAKTPHVGVTRILLLHFRAVSIDPGQILDAQCFVVLAVERDCGAKWDIDDARPSVAG
jgi:hypothetical protein